MLAFWEGLLISAVLLILVIIILGFIIIPWFKKVDDENSADQTITSWGRLALPYYNNHDDFAVALPHMPVYYTVSEHAWQT
ncbi:hypothetical protein K1T71_007736 [Dendrolimus kikuchii]|uniref:Uncharacterized protein n=1 Tax=Dendrolimus kikuchii TaxID=765133 RepID=A0ACC1CZJ7_9NEOP|nr:hypothetical protein K1T71_007736 [Dendrolimus kikuchii]